MTDLSKSGDTLWYTAKIPNNQEKIFLHNQRIWLVQFKNDKLDKEYIYWRLRNYDYQKTIIWSATGTTVKHTSPWRIWEFNFWLPSLPQQKAIAEILSSLDDKIELLKKQNKTLENIGQAIFKSWFVDFEGFENDLVESEMGMIPRGWKVYKFKDIVKHLKPWTNYQPKRVANWIPFINWRHVKWGIIKLDNVQYITEDEYKRVHKAWQPEENDILITRIWTLGNVWVIKKSDLPLAVHYNNINIKADKLSFQFIYFLLQSKVFTYYYHLRKKQAVQEYITIEDVEEIPIVLPINFEEIKNIEDNLKDNYDKIKNNNLQIQTLSNLRDSLLPRLMNGKVRV